jgi:hypothetical protein
MAISCSRLTCLLWVAVNFNRLADCAGVLTALKTGIFFASQSGTAFLRRWQAMQKGLSSAVATSVSCLVRGADV